MAKKKTGFTKQGVRDLNNLKGKSVGVKLEMPPAPEECGHHVGFEPAGKWVKCPQCGTVIADIKDIWG